jgi:hypothetical protein
VTENACPEFLKPRLRLFLSADIVGSTAMKQSPAHGSTTDPKIRTTSRMAWFSKIQGFYIEAYRNFIENWAAAKQASCDNDKFGDQPTLWKTVGDEILFTKLISDHRQVAETLRVWLTTIHAVRQFLQKDGKALDIKATAWVAGFPLRNSEVAVISDATQMATLTTGDSDDGEWFAAGGKILDDLYSKGPPPPGSVDFIGPAIDTGFRLSEFSSSRRFVVSLDVAYILARTNPGDVDSDPIFSVYYYGPKNLKGVIGGHGYPVFWIDSSPLDSVDRLEDNLTGLIPLNRDRLKEYSSRFFSENIRYLSPPFIVSSTEQSLGKAPDGYEEDRDALIRSFQGEALDVLDIEKSLESDSVNGSTVTIDDPDASIEKLLEDLLKEASPSTENGSEEAE